MVKIGVVGGTGYTGVELLRILAMHPNVDVAVVTSRAEAGVRVDDLYPSLRGFNDRVFAAPSVEALSECELVFFATPNGTAMKMAPELLARGVKIVDLAADFRLREAEEWAHWYGEPHACPELLQEAVYGLPEFSREAIKAARLVANPGCYPTAVQLGFAPLLRAGLIEPDTLIADAKSGVSGAGRGAKVPSLFSEAGESFSAYGVSGHRHLPEISQGLRSIAGGPVGLTFVPHLTPMVRGIHATLYGRLLKPVEAPALQALYEQTYATERFVDVLPAGSHPSTKSVRATNVCQLAVHRPQGGNMVVVLSVIDNLVKGAAGQAVHNMNLMLGFDEVAGLRSPAIYP